MEGVCEADWNRQYGRWDWDCEGTEAAESRREMLAESSPVTDGNAEMSRCVCECLRLCVCVCVCACVRVCALFVSMPTLWITLS